MIHQADTIQMLIKNDALATPEEKQAILSALRGNTNKKPKLISKKVVADILGTSTKTIDRYAERGHIKPIRFSQRKIRYDENQVLDFARNGISPEVVR